MLVPLSCHPTKITNSPALDADEADRKAILSHFERAIAKVGAVGQVRLHGSSYPGPFPGITESDGPHFRQLKQALQEVWRDDDGSVSQQSGRVTRS